MIDKIDIDVIKNKLEDYLTSKGINTRKNFKCLSPGHKDGDPSARFYKSSNKVYCYGCGKYYDIFDLIGLEYGLNNFTDQYNRACEIFNYGDITPSDTVDIKQNDKEEPKIEYKEVKTITEEQYKRAEFIKNVAKVKDPSNYLQLIRKIGPEVQERFNIGYDKAHNAVVIPTGSYSYTSRMIEPKKYKPRFYNGGPVEIFNKESLYTTDGPVFITEGPIDALSIMEVGAEAVGLGGVGQINKLINYINLKGKPKARIIIALDKDEAGQEATKKLTEQLKAMNVDYELARVEELFLGQDDPNDAISADKEKFKEEVLKYKAITDTENIDAVDEEKQRQLEEYNKISAAGTFNDLMRFINNNTNKYISTGFKELDNAIGGGLGPRLYFIGAGTGIGKTTFVMQVADQIAKSRKADVLIFSLEMSKEELLLKSISRETYECWDSTNKREKLDNSATLREVSDLRLMARLTKDQRINIAKAMTTYKKYADKIYIYEGLFNIDVNRIREAIEDHIKITGNKPVVIVDYFQALRPLDPRATDKMNADTNVQALKTISKNLGVPVVTISSINRSNYDKEINLAAFKESGAIEYTADVLIGLDIDGVDNGNNDDERREARENALARKERPIKLKILKCRLGQSVGEIKYTFRPSCNHFEEIEISNKNKKRNSDYDF